MIRSTLAGPGKLVLLPILGATLLAVSGAAPGLDDSKGPPDPLTLALEEAGIRPGALGFTPRGSWIRYPDPRDIPHLNRLFSDLFAHPDRIDDVLRLMAQAGSDFLRPEYLERKHDGLFRACYYVGWDLRLSGFRDYEADLYETVPEEDPIVFAVERLYRDLGRSLDLHVMSKPADFPLRRKEVEEASAGLDPALRRIIGQGILDLADALRWHRIAFRKVDHKDLLAAWELRDLGATQFDAMEYFPALDDVAGDLDEASLITSARKVVWGAGRLERSLRLWAKETKADLAVQEFDLLTPAGRIIVSGGGNDTHKERGVLLLVDLGGDDAYEGATGATDSPLRGVSLALDLSGDDRYVATEERIPSQGSGIFGTGVLLDAAGNDSYEAVGSSQGYGFFGTGLLADLEGADRYGLGVEGQGASEFGVGLLLDAGGDDEYRIVSGGQGFGGVGGGIGTLLDFSGNDLYFAEPESAKAFRPDYHSGGKVNYSYAQGAGAGRRGDLSDGHSWAGGMGTLLDLAGNDTYVSGNWSAGSGYWYGMGFLYDRSGDDSYKASVFSLASGAHFCIGAIIDEEGDDSYEGYGDSHTGMAFGHDYTVALLLDGGGNDSYRYRRDGFGHAINMSQAFFIDVGGDDRYLIDAKGQGFGITDFRPERDLRLAVNRAYTGDNVQVGLFLDTAGKDLYQERDPETGDVRLSEAQQDGGSRLRPGDPAGEADGRHAGIFRDLDLPVGPLGWFRSRLAPLTLPKAEGD